MFLKFLRFLSFLSVYVVNHIQHKVYHFNHFKVNNSVGFPHSSIGKESACNAGDPSWVGNIHWRRDRLPTPVFLGFLCGSAGKESTCNAGDLGLIPGLGRSPGEGRSYPLWYSGLENSMDYSPWSHKESDTTEQLSLVTCQFSGIKSIHNIVQPSPLSISRTFSAS